MAGVSVDGKRGGRRQLDSEINMVPMIDLLMVTISFLLITAVWVHSSRLPSSANVPGPPDAPPCEADACKEEARLHVDASDPAKFVLAWRQGRTVVRSVDVPREPLRRKGPGFPALAAKVDGEWRATGAHRDASDPRFDKAVVHASNEMAYAELVAVMDAVAQPKRTVRRGGATTQAPAFEITFAVD